MITSWVLVMFMTFDRSGSISTIPNLRSHEECQRVYHTIKNWREKSIDAICVEVFNK